jgi:hypothetical protein
MTTAKDFKPNTAAPHVRQATKGKPAAETPKRSAGLSPSAAFLMGVAVGASIEDAKPHGDQAHVHLSMGDETKDCTNERDQHDFGL